MHDQVFETENTAELRYGHVYLPGVDANGSVISNVSLENFQDDACVDRVMKRALF
jgi:hypothetical protein